MNDGTTCCVTFSDASRCPRLKAYANGWCRQCYKWSKANAGANPNGRIQRTTPTEPCAVTFADGTRCPRTALLKSPYCRVCRAWSERHGGVNPNGREKPTSGPDSGHKTCTVVEQDKLCGLASKATKDGEHLCSMHYERWKRHGDALVTVGRPYGEILGELEAAAKATTDECILMPGPGGQRPRARLGDREVWASRAVWIIVCGDPGEASVLHTCHRGLEGCINIRHLHLGDQQQNVQDMVEAERQARGEDNGGACLKRTEVREIRRLASEGVPYKVIAERFTTSVSNVSLIVLRKRWGWLEE